MKKTLYAACGSNLNLAQMTRRCPDASVYSGAELRDHELVFRGGSSHAVATIKPSEGGSVPILLWEISGRDEKELDIYEGWPSFYEKQTLDFEVEGKLVSAMAYVMTPGHEPGLPSYQYYSTIEEGYLDCGFDPSVLMQALKRSEELMAQEQVAMPEQTGFQMGWPE